MKKDISQNPPEIILQETNCLKPADKLVITTEKHSIVEKETPIKNAKDGIFIKVGTTIEDASNQLIEATLEATDYNRTKASKILGIGLRTLRRKLNTPSE